MTERDHIALTEVSAPLSTRSVLERDTDAWVRLLHQGNPVVSAAHATMPATPVTVLEVTNALHAFDGDPDALHVFLLAQLDAYHADLHAAPTPPLIHTHTPTLRQVAAAAQLVQDVAHLTGWPKPTAQPGNLIRANAFNRLARAIHRHVVTDPTRPGNPVIATGIILPTQTSPFWTSHSHLPAATRELAQADALVEVGSLAVHPDYHRRGIATRVLNEAVTWALTRGYVPVVQAI